MIAAPSGTPPRGSTPIPARVVVHSPLTPSRRGGSRRRQRRSYYGATMLGLVLVVGTIASMLRQRAEALPPRPIVFEPVLVYAPLRLDGALVLGAARDWAVNRTSAARLGDPVPVSLTAYCLKGLTRRDRYVRQGIVAADPRIFPLARYIEVYVGRNYYGRFLIDDTGGKIKGNHLDIWTPTCSDARRFGWQHGTAVLVPRPRGARTDTLMTGRLGGAGRVPGN